MLARRVGAFEVLRYRFRNERASPLTLIYNIPQVQFSRLVGDVTRFMCGADTKSMLEIYDKYPPRNVTPNGMVVPKRNRILEYNLVVKSFSAIIEGMGISDLIESWHIPLNVRFKSSEVSSLNMSRAHPTEHPHSDSWAGESSESVTVHIPIMGDWENNYVQMFYPDGEFKEDWLGPRKSYADGQDLLPHYSPINYVTPLGSLALMDFATLHASTRRPNCGPRVSIDTTFVLKKEGMSEKIHQWRENERASDEVLRGIGEKYLFYFPDSPDVQVDTKGGFKHPTNLVVKNLD